MLKIQTYLKTHGLGKTVEDFKLILKQYDDGKILLKYNQIESDFSKEEVKECRGLILEKNTYDVISMNFKKFFNYGEVYQDKIDWDSALITEKIDGSLICLYSYNNKWFTSTSGMAEGEGEVNNKPDLTFKDLFWNTLKKYKEFNIKNLNESLIYIFELTTPYNIVVTPHKESSLTLLTIRNKISLEEEKKEYLEVYSKLLGIPLVKIFDFKNKNIQVLLNTFENMPYYEEGYVVVDKFFNRIKLKNPKYLVVHRVKGRTAEHHILDVIKLNELDEYISTLPERKDELLILKEKYDILLVKLKYFWSELEKPKNLTKEERKNYAQKVFDICNKNNIELFSGLYFMLVDNKITSIEEYLINFDNKKLYNNFK